MADMFNKDGVLHFNYQAQDLAPAEAEARVKLEKDLAALIAIPQAERTFENSSFFRSSVLASWIKAISSSGIPASMNFFFRSL